MKEKVHGHAGRDVKWLLSYTFWYLLIALGVYAIFTLDGKTLIWADDGLYQVYHTISYISSHVRAFFETGHFAFDMMDFTLGQGMDTLACMCFYGLTDPLNLLGSLTTGVGMETMYAVIAGMRLYLAGAAFGLYLRYVLKAENWATAAVSIMYAVSGYLIFAAVRHPHFINGALYLPLILYGVEKFLRSRKPHAFIGFTALMLFVNFYFAYINTIIAIFYIILRLSFRFRERRVAGTAADGFGLLGSYLLGAAISAVVFLPISYLYLQNGRALINQGYTDSLLRYPMTYYIKLLTGVTQPIGSAGHWSIAGLSPIALFCAALLLFKRKKSWAEIQILIGIAALFLLLCFPFAGKILNGFGYVTNRWSYALSFPVCAAGAIMLPELATLSKKRLIGLGLFWGAYLAVAVPLSFFLNKAKYNAAGFAAMIGCFAALVALRVIRMKGKFLFQLLISLLVFSYAFFAYSPLLNDYAAAFNERGVYDRIMNDNLAALRLIDEEGSYRATETNINDPLSSLVGYMPVSYYWSIVPAWTTDYQMSVALSSRTFFHNVYGLDGRTTLNALAGLKYIVRPKDSLSLLPYGSAPVAETEGAVVYRNPYALPFGYAFTSAISEESLEGLTPVDRELAYAQFAVVENSAKSGLPAGEYQSAVAELDCTLQAVSGVELQNNRIVSKKGGRMRILFDAPANQNVYILIDGLVAKRPSTTGATTLSFTSGGIAGQGFLTDNENSFSYEQEALLLDLGCTDGLRDGADLLIVHAAKIDYDSIRVFAVPIEEITSPLEALAARPLTDIQISNNRISGGINLDAPAILQISVQYGDGWSATVDGEKAEVFRSGGMYTAILLDAGAHTVALSYRTPFIIEGAVLSGAGLLVWIALAVFLRRRCI